MSSLMERAEEVCEIIESMFFEGGTPGIDPLLFLEHDGKIRYLPLSMNSLEEKDKVALMLEWMIKHKNIREFIMVSEVWMAKKLTKEDVLNINVPVSQMPDRKEALMVQYMSPNGMTMYLSEINRDGDKVTLGDWQKEVMKNSGNVPMIDTRFGSVFTRALAGSN